MCGGRYAGLTVDPLDEYRELDAGGVGTTSGLLDALEWVMDNRATYQIRVVNISLGTAAVDSYLYDPLCLAVRGLVDAGIVVVAAAGNEGKNADGDKVYGLIHSPGIEPSAITLSPHSTQVRYGSRSRLRPASAIPTPIGSPWPSEPVATSTQGTRGVG